MDYLFIVDQRSVNDVTLKIFRNYIL